MSGRSRFLRVLVVVGGLAALPLTVGSSGRLIRVNEAQCEQLGGTCCDEQGATCYPNSCTNGLCSQPGAYWHEGSGRC